MAVTGTRTLLDWDRRQLDAAARVAKVKTVTEMREVLRSGGTDNFASADDRTVMAAFLGHAQAVLAAVTALAEDLAAG